MSIRKKNGNDSYNNYGNIYHINNGIMNNNISNDTIINNEANQGNGTADTANMAQTVGKTTPGTTDTTSPQKPDHRNKFLEILSKYYWALVIPIVASVIAALLISMCVPPTTAPPSPTPVESSPQPPTPTPTSPPTPTPTPSSVVYSAAMARNGGNAAALRGILPHYLDGNDLAIAALPGGGVAVCGHPWYGDQLEGISPDTGYCDFSSWDNETITQVMDASTYAAALTDMGDVLILRYLFQVTGNVNPQVIVKGNFSSVTSWEDMVQISATPSFIAGLQSNGNVRVAGNINFNQNDAQNWEDIVQLSTGRRFVIGLNSEGDVMITLPALQKEVRKWKNEQVVQVAGDVGTSVNYALGLTREGKVVTAGAVENFQMDFSHWEDVVYLCARFGCVLGLTESGEVLQTGRNMFSGVLGWQDIQEIHVGNWFAVGMKKTGEIVAVNGSIYPRYGRMEIVNLMDYVMLQKQAELSAAGGRCSEAEAQ